MNRINGKSFDVRIMGIKVHFEKFSLSVEDGSQEAQTNGVPDGWLLGDVKASGEIEVDSANFSYLSQAAVAAGSWRGIPAFDIDAYAIGENSRSEELMHVHAFDCKLVINDVLNVDKSQVDKNMHKIKFVVTGPDFIKINGVPYLESDALTFV